MKDLLNWQNISRQGAHQGIARMDKAQCDVIDTVELASAIRKDHPQMGCRDMYYAKREQMPRGRDWTERVLLSCGYRVKAPRRSFTQAGEDICSNLIEGMRLTGPNQLWQTDITYSWCDHRWYYLSFVIDVYTRQIIGSHCSRNLSSASQLHCLKKAVKSQKGRNLDQLIVHTDRGTQYTCGRYKDYLQKKGFKQSMAHYAWQNAYSERVNRTIKNNYLKHYRIKTYQNLSVGLTKAVRAYNNSKPHRGLPERLSPTQFIKERSQGKHADYEFKIWSKLTSTKTLHVN